MKDDFEQQLKSQPFRPVPAQWREEILKAAQAEVEANSGKPAAANFVSSWWRELLWPCPHAWAALAGIWFVVLLLNFGSDEPAVAKVAKSRPVSISPQILTALQEQRRLYVELIEPAQTKEEETRPRPHTEKAIGTACV